MVFTHFQLQHKGAVAILTIQRHLPRMGLMSGHISHHLKSMLAVGSTLAHRIIVGDNRAVLHANLRI